MPPGVLGAGDEAAASATEGQSGAGDDTPAVGGGGEVGVDGHRLADAHLRLIRWKAGTKPRAAVSDAAEPEPQPGS